MFVDNLPEFYDRHLLRRLFKGCGKVIDTYIPWKKRIKSNTRFGFVFFMKEEDALFAARCLNGVNLFGHVISVTKSVIHGETDSKQSKNEEQSYRTSHMKNGKGSLSYKEALLQKNKGIWVEKNAGEGSRIRGEEFPELKKNDHVNGRSKTLAFKEWEEMSYKLMQQNLKIEILERICSNMQIELTILTEEKLERERKRVEEQGVIFEENEVEGSNAMDRDEEEIETVPETVLDGGSYRVDEEKLEGEKLLSGFLVEDKETAAEKVTKGREDVSNICGKNEAEYTQQVFGREGVFNIKTKENVFKSKKKSNYTYLSLNPISLRHKFEGTRIKRKCMKKNKRIMACAWVNLVQLKKMITLVVQNQWIR